MSERFDPSIYDLPGSVGRISKKKKKKPLPESMRGWTKADKRVTPEYSKPFVVWNIKEKIKKYNQFRCSHCKTTIHDPKVHKTKCEECRKAPRYSRQSVTNRRQCERI